MPDNIASRPGRGRRDSLAQRVAAPQTRLWVRVRPLPAAPAMDDLIARLSSPSGATAWIGTDRAIIGGGEALRLSVTGPSAIRDAARRWRELIARSAVDADEGAPPVPIALGSFGFSPSTPGMLIVPALAAVREQGRWWAVSASAAGPAPDPLDDPLPPAAPLTAPTDVRTGVGTMTQGEWMAAVGRLIASLRDGAASKVVMARDISVYSSTAFDERYLLQRLHRSYPTTWTYAVGGLVGASPEMLASVRESRMTSRVLAGTSAAGRGEDLISSAKNRTEHHLAVESVTRALAPIADVLDVQGEPYVLRLPNVDHLATDVRADIGDHSALDVAGALHPTAAVCGTPTSLASTLLEAFESTERGRYSGPVGWVDGSGDGEFAIALRCGQIGEDAREMRVYAGAGIMPDSDPGEELAETRAKMAAVLEAIGVRQ